ncbi:MAG: PDZ domain-containing protein [Fimbriiglobus sp.]
MQRLLDRASGDPRTADALAAQNDAAPYIRLILAGNPDPVTSHVLAIALETIETRIFARNRARFPDWAAAGRFDLCAELLVSCRDKNEAVKLADALIPARKRVLADFNKTYPYQGNYSHPWAVLLTKMHGSLYDHFVGEQVTIPANHSRMALVRADRCIFDTYEKDSLMAAVRTEFQDPPKRAGGKGPWYNSVLLVNADVELNWVNECLVVCDGDVVLVDGRVHQSVVIANGTIRAVRRDRGAIIVDGVVVRRDPEYPVTDISRSWVAAGADIELPGRVKDIDAGVLHARGLISLDKAQPPGPEKRFFQNQPSLPYGVRFLDPKELGLDARPAAGGIRLDEVAAGSPFAGPGLRAGDVIQVMNGRPVGTSQEFRRELRRAIVMGSAVVEVRRTTDVFANVVFLDDISVGRQQGK